MKTNRYLLSLLLLVVSAFNLTPANAQQNQYAIFNYRNDGEFNAFLNSEVDSITYSNIDLDNVEHEDVVVQVVWTPDSVYRIPINAIDSIGFHAPAPKYSEKTFPIMEELLPYIVEVNDLSITFSPTTPQSILPAIGQIMVAETWDAPLEDGFAGRVIEIRQVASGMEYVCEDVRLGDIFESLVFVSRCITSENAQTPKPNLLPRKSFWDRDIIIPEDTKEIDMIEFEFENDGPLSFKYKPSMIIKYEFYIVEKEPNRMKMTFTLRHDFTLHGEHKLELPKEKSSKEWLNKKKIPIPIPIPAVSKIVRPYVQYGAFVDAKAKASFEFDLATWSEMTFGVDYNEEREGDEFHFIKNSDGGINSEKTKLSLSLDGSFAAGLAIVLGANIVHKRLLNFEGHFHIGPMIKGKFELSTENLAEEANLYRLLKDTKLEVDGYLSVTAQYNILGRVKLAKRGTWKGATWDSNHKETLVDGSLQWTWPFFEWYLLPEFGKPVVKRSTANSASCIIYPKREILPMWPPLHIGVAFENYSTGKAIEKDYGPYSSENYEGKLYSGDPFFQEFITPLEENVIYKVYPTVTLWDKIKMKAEPSIDYGNSDHISALPKILEIEKGKTGEVEIVGGSGDYQVTDINSDIARSVQLTPVNNQKKAILTIYGVEFGDAVFTITDKKNPSSRIDVNVNVTVTSEWGGEAIDLGLPSGTLWASCNVGATKPEEYGDYFAWGETKPKEDYSWSTYKWCNGSSSSLTKYTGSDGKTELDLEDDAAYVNWGSNWRMPSLEQIQELIDNCNWEWMLLNGVNGRKVIGPNGKFIFLPTGGYRKEEGLFDTVSGHYWSYILYTKSPGYSCDLGFSNNYVDWDDYGSVPNRCFGQSVRPVRMSNQNGGTGSGTGSGGDSGGSGTGGGRDRN